MSAGGNQKEGDRMPLTLERILPDPVVLSQDTYEVELEFKFTGTPTPDHSIVVLTIGDPVKPTYNNTWMAVTTNSKLPLSRRAGEIELTVVERPNSTVAGHGDIYVGRDVISVIQESEKHDVAKKRFLVAAVIMAAVAITTWLYFSIQPKVSGDAAELKRRAEATKANPKFVPYVVFWRSRFILTDPPEFLVVNEDGRGDDGAAVTATVVYRIPSGYDAHWKKAQEGGVVPLPPQFRSWPQAPAQASEMLRYAGDNGMDLGSVRVAGKKYYGKTYTTPRGRLTPVSVN